MKKFLLLALMLFSTSAMAADYKPDYTASQIEFSGTHADNKFTGKIEKWTAEISFDPKQLETSSIKAEFDLATAKTGNKMYDGTLPEADWFNTKQFPKASFVSTAIKANPDNSFTATGNLTIRSITHPVDLVFTVTDLTKSPVTADGHFIIKRLDYDLGKKTDDKAEWVSKDITVTLKIVATPVK